jgi:hypothetical protein
LTGSAAVLRVFVHELLYFVFIFKGNYYYIKDKGKVCFSSVCVDVFPGYNKIGHRREEVAVLYLSRPSRPVGPPEEDPEKSSSKSRGI